LRQYLGTNSYNKNKKGIHEVKLKMAIKHKSWACALFFHEFATMGKDWISKSKQVLKNLQAPPNL